MSVFPSMLLPLSDIVFSGTFALPARRGESRSWSVSCHRLPERASAPPAPPPRELPSIPSFPSRGSPKPSDPQPLPWGGEQSALGAAGPPQDHGTQHPWVALGRRAAPPGGDTEGQAAEVGGKKTRPQTNIFHFCFAHSLLPSPQGQTLSPSASGTPRKSPCLQRGEADSGRHIDNSGYKHPRLIPSQRGLTPEEPQGRRRCRREGPSWGAAAAPGRF